jgi:beta-galactosidase GanA
VIAPVSWELIEPREGEFDWSSIDSMIQAAKANRLKLVVLWFGAWKNSMSTYVPAWIKRDQARFPRAALPSGEGVEILSPFSAETLRADQRAFAALMRHLKTTDKDQTVVLTQVENEIGMLPVVRDYSVAANAAFQQPVPKPLVARSRGEAAGKLGRVVRHRRCRRGSIHRVALRALCRCAMRVG